jgi:hypothetical protein
LITLVDIGFTTTSFSCCIFTVSVLYLHYRMSDKRLLKRCGAGNGFLTEAGSGSVRLPGLHIRRAGVRAKGRKFRVSRQIAEKRKRSFNDWVTGLK